jgi:hypothetical protein
MISGEIESHCELVRLEQLGEAQGRRPAASSTCEEMGTYYSPLWW